MYGEQANNFLNILPTRMCILFNLVPAFCLKKVLYLRPLLNILKTQGIAECHEFVKAGFHSG